MKSVSHKYLIIGVSLRSQRLRGDCSYPEKSRKPDQNGPFRVIAMCGAPDW